ncbi:hypothetical protein FHX11_001556 [Rhizobium sp. BK602]|nr:hypothetical protein [Rhizobium sp. BK602]
MITPDIVVAAIKIFLPLILVAWFFHWVSKDIDRDRP